jgi:PAS domain S-box-containing protein
VVADIAFALESIDAARQQAEAKSALVAAHARLRRFVDANIIGVVIARPSGEVLEANDYYLRTIGYTREEFEKGLVDWRAITPAEWLPADERPSRSLAGRGYAVRRISAADGRVFGLPVQRRCLGRIGIAGLL